MRKKCFFKFIDLKKHTIMFMILFIMLCIIAFSSSSYEAAKDAITLWMNNVIPSLFPFFICIELLKQTTFIQLIGRLLTPIMKPLFGVSGCGAFALAMGMSSGYPTGAKITADLYQNGHIEKKEAERLLTFTNTSGPLFIISAIGVGMFHDAKIGLLLLITHFLGSITTGILFRNYGLNYKDTTTQTRILSHFSEKRNRNDHKIPFSFQNLGYYMGISIHNSIQTLLLICGYMVFFAILINIMEQLHFFSFLTTILTTEIDLIPTNYISPILKGCLEVTGGLKSLSNLVGDVNAILPIASFILGFGGCSVLMQTASIISQTDLSIKPYILGKLTHGILSAWYTFFSLKYTHFFHFQIISTFQYNKPNHLFLYETSNLFTVLSTLFLLSILLKTILIYKRKKKK